MERGIKIIVRLIQAGGRSYERKWSFLGISVPVFFLNVFLLGQCGLLPNALLASAKEDISSSGGAIATLSSTPVVGAEEPMKIVIPKISLTATIANPTTARIELLDTYLLKGAVRYPTSAKLGEIGNVVLFGHSSYLPIVGNQAYKTFNGIQRLVAGDTIILYSVDAAYTYRVRTVAKESAASGVTIPLAVAGRILTLSTCDSFGAKTDRFVATADFVESHSISNN